MEKVEVSLKLNIVYTILAKEIEDFEIVHNSILGCE